jgi:hypothetical protein
MAMMRSDLAHPPHSSLIVAVAAEDVRAAGSI